MFRFDPVTLLVLAFLVCGCQRDAGTEPAGNDQKAGPPERIPPDQPPTQQISADDYERAEYLRRRGTGHMENMDWSESETALSELADLLPNDRTALRNLAIQRVLALTEPNSPYRSSGSQQERQEFSQAVDRAITAIENYRSKADAAEDQSIADLLQGKVLVHADRPEAASFDEGVSLLRRAADSQPDRADLRLAVAVALKGNRRYENSPEVLRELGKAFELAPNNLHAMRLYLDTLALALRSTDEATRELAATGLRDVLPKVKELVEPLNESVLRNTRVNLMKTLDDAIGGASEDAGALMRPAMVVSNTIRSEIPVQIDMRRVDRHLLEFVLPRFDDGFYAVSRDAGVESPFTDSVLRKFTAVELPDALSGLTDLRVEDVTLDGLNDLVVIRSGSLEVWSGSAAGANDWALTTADPEDDGKWEHVLAADIDRDFDSAASNLGAPHLLEDRDGDRKIVSDPAGRPRWFDTDLDLIAWNDSELAIYRNELSESGERSLLTVSRHPLEGINDVAAADIDADGDLDIVVAATDAVHVLVNTNGTVFEQRQLADVGLSDLIVGDVDRNIATDLVGTSLDGGVGLLQNLFHARFRWLPGTDVFGDGSRGDRVKIADVDGNLSWDVVTSGPAGLSVIRTKTTAPGVMSGLATDTITTNPVTDFALADLDNDGHQDIAALTQTGIVLYRGLPDGAFAELDIETPDVVGSSIAANDLDHDGDPDLLVIDTVGRLRLLDNEGGNSNHWIDIVVRGKEDDPQFRSRRVNMHGVGAVVEVMAGPLWQAHVVDSPVMHIGLGQADRLDAIRVVWTDGVPQDVVTDALLRPRVGILAPQILKGSCPYIYTWNGDGFEFFSDCLWSAPIGLVQASGDLAPTREWEHLLISGDRLVPRGGEYVLQVTEELWEIAYFDQIELFAIDHPSDVQIFTNEKVGPPSLAEHRIHTVRHPRRPRSVIDGRGTDLLPGLSGMDGDYVQAFTTRRVQGLTDEWTMEFDLGDIDDASDVRLFLTGWIFPTDTSLNYHIHQNPDLHPPAPPSIEVPDGDGWRTVRPFIGFPGGKTKAMVIDLTGIVGPDNTHFRLRSSMELYFDDAFFTTGETDEPTMSHVCELVNADLHHRGYSRRTYAPESVFRQGNAPEGYDYNRVTTDSRWPPLSGRFTRYGSVGELLQNADDRLAVMGPGDEMTVRFSVPTTPVPDGWTRDFMLRNVGWDKDADLNTVYGQSSEPLPFRAMTRYPFAETDSIPNSAQYRSYLDNYQTREYSPYPFWRSVVPSLRF